MKYKELVKLADTLRKSGDLCTDVRPVGRRSRLDAFLWSSRKVLKAVHCRSDEITHAALLFLYDGFDTLHVTFNVSTLGWSGEAYVLTPDPTRGFDYYTALQSIEFRSQIVGPVLCTCSAANNEGKVVGETHLRIEIDK